MISPEILEEYERVGEELAVGRSEVDLRPILGLVVANADICVAPPLDEPACEDPDDDKFLACALAADVDLIVSGDKHLIALDGFRGIEILRPRPFVDRYL